MSNINKQASFYAQYKSLYEKGLHSGVPSSKSVAMEQSSSSKTTNYAWLGDIPGVREWLGERQLNKLKEEGYSITNKKYEQTVGVDVDDLEDNQSETYGPLFEMMGHNNAMHQDKLVYGAIVDGITLNCYDGTPFLGTTHPRENGLADQSNYDTNSGALWCLVDTSKPIKPMIFQVRLRPKFTKLDDDKSTFWTDKVVYGTKARYNAGYGLWQLIFGSKETLDATGFNVAWNAMRAFTDDYGEPLGIKPDTLICTSSNEIAARTLLLMDKLASGASNPHFGLIKNIIVTDHLV